MMTLPPSLEAIAVLAVMGAIGWWAQGRKVLSADILPPLRTLALDVALPCLVFAGIVRGFDPASNPGWWRLPLWWGVFTAGAFALTWVLGFAVRDEYRREFKLCLFYQSGMFLPLALLTEMFGPDSEYIVDLFLMMLFFPAFFFGTHAFFFRRGGPVNLREVFHPTLLVTVLAIVLCLLGVREGVPSFLVTATRQVGATAVPLLVIMLGARLRSDLTKTGRPPAREIVLFILAKNVTFPLITILLVRALQWSGPIAMLLILQAATPPIISLPAVAERLGGNTKAAGYFVLAGYAAAVVTVPLSLAFATGIWR